MSFKDLGKRNVQPRADTPEDTELRARAAARHRAKEERAAARSEEHRAGKREPDPAGAKREPPK
jgi:hypothetical protein